MRSRITGAGLALLLAATAAPAADEPRAAPAPAKSLHVPYKLTDSKHVMVRVKLNGKGPFNFILDTGAPALIMTEAVAKKVGAEAEKGGWAKYKLEVEGGVTLPNAKGIGMDMFQLKGMNAMGIAGVELHGVLGYNVLAKFRIEYDFTKDKLVWTKLDFDPPPLKRLSEEERGDQGGLEMVGTMMKFLAPLMGLKPNFAVRPRGFLGVALEERNDEVFVKSVVKDGPADKAGVKPGDRIEFARNTSVDSAEDLLKAAGRLGEGDKLKLKVKRGGETVELTVELGKGL